MCLQMVGTRCMNVTLLLKNEYISILIILHTITHFRYGVLTLIDEKSEYEYFSIV